MKKARCLRPCFSAVLGWVLLSGAPFHANATLVRSGPEGLAYTPYANEGSGDAVHRIPDFSSAGYRGGGVAIPYVPVAKIPPGPCKDCSEECSKIPIIFPLKPTGGDDTAMIQCAINRVSRLEPVGETPFRGAVVLDAGEFLVTRPLFLKTGGVVIRGAGSQEAGGTKIVFSTQRQEDLFLVQGGGKPEIPNFAGGLPQPSGTSQTVSEDLVPVGALQLPVTSGSSFAKGDLIRITNTTNEQWVKDIGMDRIRTPDGKRVRGWTPKKFQLRTFRIVEDVQGNTLTLNAPIVQAIEKKYGGAQVVKCGDEHLLQHVGLEGLRLEATFDHEYDEGHGWRGIQFSLGVRNAWVRQVTAQHFGHSLVSIEPGSQFITVEDCAFLDPKSMMGPTGRNSFAVNMSTGILIQRCLTRDGWHDYSTGLKTSGPNVLVDVVATQANHQSGPRDHYSMGELYDNLLLEAQKPREPSPTEPAQDAALRIQKSNVKGDRGWRGGQIMLWNVKAPEVVVDTPAGAMNWAFGVEGTQASSTNSPDAAEGTWVSPLRPVKPRSLYYGQLADRLGAGAAKSVMLPAQENGSIWRQLKEWGGDGLLEDSVVTWHDHTVKPIAGVGLELHALIRDLPMLDYYLDVRWSKVSGPGQVKFYNENALETEATFEKEGRYTLQLDVGDGQRTVSSKLLVFIEHATDFPTVDEPVDLTTKVTEKSVRLNWPEAKDEGVGHYSLYRSQSSKELGELIAKRLNGTRYVDKDVKSGTAYHYVVTTTDERGYTSFYSHKTQIKTDKAEPKIHVVRRSDFGARWDKTTARNAGYRVKVQGGLGGHFDEVYRVWNPTQDLLTYSIQRDFVEVQDPTWEDFSIQMDASLWSKGNPELGESQFGLVLFGDAERPMGTGLTAMLRYEEGQMRMAIRDGKTGTDLQQQVFKTTPVTDGEYPFPVGVTYTFDVEGTFAKDGTLELAFTLTDGDTEKTLIHNLDVSEMEGLSVGGVANIGHRFAVDFDSITVSLVELPE